MFKSQTSNVDISDIIYISSLSAFLRYTRLYLKLNLNNALSSNWTLHNKKIEILAYKWFSEIEKNKTPLNDKIVRFELARTPINKRRNELLSSLRPVLLRDLDFIASVASPSLAPSLTRVALSSPEASLTIAHGVVALLSAD